MRREVSAFVLLGSLIAWPAAAEITFKAARTQTPDRRSITYDVTLKGYKDKTVTIALPNAGGDAVASVSPNSTTGACKGPSLADGVLVWTCVPKEDSTGTAITLSGPVRRLQYGSVEAAVTVDGGDSGRWQVDGLVASHDERFLRAVVGGGVSVLLDDYVDFKVEDGALRVTNDSQVRTAALVGGQFHLFDVPIWGRRSKEVSALVSLEFTQGTSRVLDGFQFGVGFELNRYLTLVAGYALRKGQEVSHGFQGAAAGVIAAQQAASNTAYARFPTLREGATAYGSTELERLDGLPLTAPGATQTFFTGSPVVDSYNKSVFFGFVVPLNLGALLSAP